MDSHFMKAAIELAKKGLGYVNPNPLVGAVVVKNGKIIGKGYHENYGGPHAEVHAINRSSESVRDATIYVTLEPCSHYGKTPPCVDLIIKNKLSRVVIGLIDSNPLVAGKSVEKLRLAGIEVITGVLKEEISDMNRYFLKHIQVQKPYVTLKTAMTLDGKIATKSGDSKWISGEQSRVLVHEMRQDMMGIMVGIGTVLKDDPSLTTRLNNRDCRHPRPIIIDSKGRLPLDCKIIKSHKPNDIILATTDAISAERENTFLGLGLTVLKVKSKEKKVDLNLLMAKLGAMNIDSILLEGGSELNGNALESGIVDEVISFIAPKIVGGENVKSPVAGRGVAMMKEAYKLEFLNITTIGDDIMVRSKITR